MKKLFLLLVTAGLIGSTFSQNDPNAKKILDEVSNKVKSFSGITADFSYATLRNNVKKGAVAGKIYVKGQKYFIKQGATEIYSDGAKLWNFDGSKEVTVSDLDNDARTLSPQKLLTNFYDKDFSYRLVNSKGNFHEIQLVPNDKRKNFKQVNIFVDKSKKLISKAIILDKSNNTIEFALKNVNTSVSLPDSRFVFDVKSHPGVEIIQQ